MGARRRAKATKVIKKAIMILLMTASTGPPWDGNPCRSFQSQIHFISIRSLRLVWTSTSGLSSNRARPILCPLQTVIRCWMPLNCPVWRAGRAESENPRTHHHEGSRAVHPPNMGMLLIKWLAPSPKDGKFSGWLSLPSIYGNSIFGRSIRLKPSRQKCPFSKMGC